MTLNPIEKIEIAYINERGIRRVGQACAVTPHGEFFKVEHKAGYYVIVSDDQITQ